MRLGEDMVHKNLKTQYVHWNDPNELTKRLMLLIGSQPAGNN